MIALEPTKMYSIGIFSFFTIMLCSIISLIDKFAIMTGSQIVSQIAYIVFYSAIIGSFTYLKKQASKPLPSEKDMEAMLSKYQEDNKNAKSS